MKILVLIATYINSFSSIRNETIKYTLQSLEENIKKPDHIYISCSYSQEKPDTDSWKKIVKNIDCTIVLHEKKQLFQFEQYKILMQFVQFDDIVCFLDDDDLYCKSKIFEVYQYFEKHPKTQAIYHPYIVFGTGNSCLTEKNISDIKNTNYIVTYREHWACSFRGKVLLDWFNTGFKKMHLKSFEEMIDSFGALTDLIFISSISCDIILFTQKYLVYKRNENIKKDYFYTQKKSNFVRY